MKVPADLQARIARAKTERSNVQGLINGYLKYADPVRPRIGDSLTSPSNRSEEVDDRFDTQLEESGEDFASDLLQRAMPRDKDWLKYEPIETLSQEEAKVIQEPLETRTKSIFAAIRSSNFYREAAGEWAWDQGHGTSAIIGYDPGKGQPHYWEAIAPGQLLIGRGARGLNFKARESCHELAELIAYWPDYAWPEKLKREALTPQGKCKKVILTEAATLVPDPGDEVWKWQVCVDGFLIHEEELRGRGCCPIIVTRWRTFSTTPWGYGPLLKAVPDARVLDQLEYLVLKNLGKQVDPPFFYDDDNVINLEAGLDAGMAIARQAGSSVDFWEGGRLELAFFEQGTIRDKIRRAAFQSGPRQKGLTPPTLGQWMDEKGEQGRRLEMPTGRLFEEGVIAVVERTEYMLQKAGKLAEVLQIKDKQKFVRLRPLNPLALQQDFEKANNSRILLETIKQVFGPEVTASIVDAGPTIENLKKLFNDEAVAIRDPEAADQLLRGVLGQPGMAPGLETAPPGAPEAAPQ